MRVAIGRIRVVKSAWTDVRGIFFYLWAGMYSIIVDARRYDVEAEAEGVEENYFRTCSGMQLSATHLIQLDGGLIYVWRVVGVRRRKVELNQFHLSLEFVEIFFPHAISYFETQHVYQHATCFDNAISTNVSLI